MAVPTLAVGKRRDDSILSWVATRESPGKLLNKRGRFVEANGRILHVYSMNLVSLQIRDRCGDMRNHVAEMNGKGRGAPIVSKRVLKMEHGTMPFMDIFR
jgi:hypothetical protein